MEIITKSSKADKARGVGAEGGWKDTICDGESAFDDNVSGEEVGCFIHLCNTIWCQPFGESVRGKDKRS